VSKGRRTAGSSWLHLREESLVGILQNLGEIFFLMFFLLKLNLIDITVNPKENTLSS
jgi:hypothetical protein